MKFLSKFRKPKNEIVKEVSTDSRVYRALNKHAVIIFSVNEDTGNYTIQTKDAIMCGDLERVNISEEGEE